MEQQLCSGCSSEGVSPIDMILVSIDNHGKGAAVLNGTYASSYLCEAEACMR